MLTYSVALFCLSSSWGRLWESFSSDSEQICSSLSSPSCSSESPKIQRAAPVICSYRHPVVLVMEMGGDTHSFRSITYIGDVRGLWRHRGNLVNSRTFRVPRGEEGRGRNREGSMTKKVGLEWGADGSLAFYWAQPLVLWEKGQVEAVEIALEELCAKTKHEEKHKADKKRKWGKFREEIREISHQNLPVIGLSVPNPFRSWVYEPVCVINKVMNSLFVNFVTFFLEHRVTQPYTDAQKMYLLKKK